MIQGLFWLVLGIFLAVVSLGFRVGSLHKPGAGFLAFLCGVALGTCGLVLLFSTVQQSAKGEIKKIWVKENLKNLVFPFLILVGYAALLDTLGFLLASFLFLFLLFKRGEPKKWFRPLIFAGSTVVLSYLLFSVWLQCQFPKGVLRF